jgi:hypothetical protein
MALFLTVNQVKAQSYSIKSMEGNQTTLQVNDTVPGKIVKISIPGDTVYIREFFGLVEVSVLQEYFLKIVYDTHGGSGLDLKNTVLLSCRKGKVNVSLLLSSYKNLLRPNISDSKKLDEVDSYNIGITVVNENQKFKLIANVHEERDYKEENKSSYVLNSVIPLDYDPQLDIFFQEKIELENSFSIIDSRARYPVNHIKVKGIIPVVKILKNTFLYINNQWYGRGSKNILYKEYD